jgi:hypothetical protein
MQDISRPFDAARVWVYFGALFVISFLAFWPSYFSPGIATSSRYTHFHAATAALWMSLLIIQPWLIRTYRFEVHRAIGRVSYVLVPVLLLSIILLANFRIRTVDHANYPIQTYVLYLQFFLGVLFAVSFFCAMIYRRDAEIHARFMVCTGLTLIDPVFARIVFWIHSPSAEYHQWLTFGLTDLVFLILIWSDRHNTRSRWVFRLMLGAFVLGQLPALLWFTNGETWQAIARWFQSIPLT